MIVANRITDILGDVNIYNTKVLYNYMNQAIFASIAGKHTFANITTLNNTADTFINIGNMNRDFSMSNYNGSGNVWNAVVSFGNITNYNIVVDGWYSNDVRPAFLIRAGGTPASLVVKNSVIYNGVVSAQTSGSVTVQNNIFSGSNPTPASISAGVVNVLQLATFSSFVLQNCSFSGYNLTSSAIMLNGTGQVTIYNSSFSSMTLGRGSVVVGSSGTSTIDGCTFTSIYNPTPGFLNLFVQTTTTGIGDL